MTNRTLGALTLVASALGAVLVQEPARSLWAAVAGAAARLPPGP